MSRRRIGWYLGAAIVAGLVVPTPAQAAAGDTTLVSRSGLYGPGADANAFDVAISADGRFVAFRSGANNLSDDDNDAAGNLYVRDVAAGTIALVNRPTGAPDPTGTTGGSFNPALSADGRFIAFDSLSDNLSADDNDAMTNVYLRDTVAGTTILVSRPSGPPDAAGTNADSGGPSISADGRFVAFSSRADNLSTDDNDAVTNVYVRDTLAGTTLLVSRPSGAPDAAGTNSDSATPAISADGRYIAFHSAADNLSADDNDAFINVYVRDAQAGTTTLVSRPTGAPDPVGTNADSYASSISASGRYIAFQSAADNLSADDNDTVVGNIYVRDVQSGLTSLVSRPSGPPDPTGTDDYSHSPTISADGRFVAFASAAENFSTDDSSIAYDEVYVRDRQLGTTTLVSRPSGAPDPTGTTGISDEPSISADGRYVAFSSDSNNLSTDDVDTVANTYLRDVRGPQPQPALLVGDVAAKEGRSGTTPFRFTVRLRGVPHQNVSVGFVTDDGGAKEPVDYAFTNGTLTFEPGEHEKQIVVPVVGDRRRERTESFEVLLQSAHGAPIVDATGIGTIKNDDR